MAVQIYHTAPRSSDNCKFALRRSDKQWYVDAKRWSPNEGDARLFDTAQGARNARTKAVVRSKNTVQCDIYEMEVYMGRKVHE